jgi:hypothetical protein
MVCAMLAASVMPALAGGPAPDEGAAEARWRPYSVSLEGVDVSSVAAGEPFQIEKSLGANCVATSVENMSEGGLNLGPCKGPLPEHLLRLFMSIPSEQIHLSPERRLEFLARGTSIKAIPGKGPTADFLVRVADVAWIRSLEGPDPAVTTYLVNGPFECPKEPEGTEPIGDVGCVDVGDSLRVFVVKNGSKPVDATQRLLSNKLQLPMAEIQRLLSYRVDHPEDALTPGELTRANWDISRLSLVPVLRRYQIIILDDPAARNEPRLYRSRLHFGFEEWNGERFVWKALVPRASWPCLDAYGRACDNRRVEVEDPFVIPLP